MRLMPHDGAGARAIADWLLAVGARDVLVVHDHDEGYGVPVGAMCVEAARARGLVVRSRPVWDHNEPPANDLGEVQAVVYVGVAGSGAVALWHDLHAANSTAWLLGTDGVAESWLARRSTPSVPPLISYQVPHRLAGSFHSGGGRRFRVDDLLAAEEAARPVDRRRFILGTAGALAAAGLAGPLAEPASANSRRRRVVPSPEPIPGGLPVGLPPPYDVIHLFLPGPPTVTLPFSGLQLQGLDVEPTTVTDFSGRTAMTYLTGTVKGSDGVTRGLEVDLRVSKGEYITADGSRERGAFAMI